VRKALITGAFLWCAVARADETSIILTPSDLEVIRHRVEGNWNGSAHRLLFAYRAVLRDRRSRL
jgi:hypothetical protein